MTVATLAVYGPFAAVVLAITVGLALVHIAHVRAR